MKHAFLLAALLALCILPAGPTRVARADQADDEAIHKRHDEWCDAWNKHDPKAMAGFFVSDGDLINPFGRECHGTTEIEKLFTEEQAGPMKDSTYSGTIEHIRYIAPDIAIIDVAGQITGMKHPDGAEAPPFKHHVAWIAQKKDGQWMALGARAFVTIPPPPMPAK